MLIGETAPTGSTDSVPPIPFARGVMCLTPEAAEEPSCESAEIGAAGWATHPYAVDRPGARSSRRPRTAS